MTLTLRRIPTPWRVVLFLFFAGGINYADRAAISSVIPPLRQELGVTDAQVGLMGMLFLWTYALVSPFAGSMADRYSRRRMVVWSLAAWSAITLVTGFAHQVMLLLILRTALGFAEAFYLPAAGALIADYHGPATRGRAVGTHILGLNFGVLFGGAFAGLLAEHYGWRMGFWVLGGTGVILALGSPLFLSEPPASVADRPSSRPRGVRAAYAYLSRCPAYYVILFAAMSAGIASWIYFTWLPLYFKENYGMNLAAAGLAGAALYKGPTMAGTALGGWLSDHAAGRGAPNRTLVNALSYLLSAPFLFLFIGVPSLGLVAAVLVVSSLVRAAGVPNEHPIICDVVPAPFRSTAIGIYNTSGAAAGGVGVLLAGLLKANLGLNTIFAASAVLYLFAGGALFLSFRLLIPAALARAQCWTEGNAAPAEAGLRPEAAVLIRPARD